MSELVLELFKNKETNLETLQKIECCEAAPGLSIFGRSGSGSCFGSGSCYCLQIKKLKSVFDYIF